jgi:hypothetical protein
LTDPPSLYVIRKHNGNDEPEEEYYVYEVLADFVYILYIYTNLFLSLPYLILLSCFSSEVEEPNLTLLPNKRHRLY